MNTTRLLLVLLLWSLLWPVQAQDTDIPPQIAFLNSSGQLIVSAADGEMRWIVTNPGEQLHPVLGFSWSPDGRRLFYAVQGEGRVSLRIWEREAQTGAEVGTVQAPASGGEWLDDAVRVAGAEQDGFYSLSGTSARVPTVAMLISPFQTAQPHLPAASSLSFNGDYTFGLRSGEYGLFSLGEPFQGLGVRNESDAVRSGLWSDVLPLVAYWGTQADGVSVLAVTAAESLATLTLASEGSTPLQPIAWFPGTGLLVYRDASSQIRTADVGCLVGGTCTENPLESGPRLLPPSATQVQIQGERIVYRDGNDILALDMACLAEATCAESAQLVATQAAPRTLVHFAGERIAYTAFLTDAANPADREVRVIDANCLPEDCPGTPLLVPNAIAGMLSPQGDYLLVEVLGDGLYSVRVQDGSRAYLTGSLGEPGEGLLTARWSN